MEWHGDSFDLPRGVTRLAESPAYTNEAFGIGNWALAVQFHPEVTASMHEDWLQLVGVDPARGDPDADAFRGQREVCSDAMQRASARMFGAWLAALR